MSRLLVASIARLCALDERRQRPRFHLYGGFQTAATIAGVKVEAPARTSGYPWEGAIRIEVQIPNGRRHFDLKLRIPGWATGSPASVNGEKDRAEARERLP